MDYCDKFTEASNWNQREAFVFFRQHRRELPLHLFKQFCLNYRTRFHHHNKERIFKDYCKYVLSKSDKHTSDLMISYNIIKYVKVSEEHEKIIVDYLGERLLNYTIPSHVIKKKIVLEMVSKIKA